MCFYICVCVCVWCSQSVRTVEVLRACETYNTELNYTKLQATLTNYITALFTNVTNVHKCNGKAKRHNNNYHGTIRLDVTVN